MIEDESIRCVFMDAVENLPDYFFTVAASSTGKYHPTYSLGEGGLVRHTKAAVKIAYDLLSREYYRNHFTSAERDCIIVALSLHDGWKHGQDGGAYTTADHPMVAADWFANQYAELGEHAQLISKLIRSHMGEWNTAPRSKKEIMPKPDDELTMFVHMCDYLASRKWLTVQFDSAEYYDPTNYEEDKCSLDALKQEIVDKCKDKISNGANREEILEFIASINNGKRNPMSINDVDIGLKIKEGLDKF